MNPPKRSLIYLFDDLNIRFAAMANLRDAAMRYFKTNLAEGDHAAIYTFSGNPTLEFTSDREKLEAAVSKLRWKPPAGHGEMQCPDVQLLHRGLNSRQRRRSGAGRFNDSYRGMRACAS